MADFDKNFLTDTKASAFTELTDRTEAIAKMDGTIANPVTGYIRWNGTANKFQIYNGTAWGDLATTFDMSVAELGGNAASHFTNASNLASGTIPVARIPSDFGSATFTFGGNVDFDNGVDVTSGDLTLTDDSEVSFSRGGGFGMPDTVWVELTGNKKFKVNSTETDSIATTGSVTAGYSDKRLKTDIENITNPLGKLRKIRGVTYKPNHVAEKKGFNADPTVGVIAQEVAKVLPQIVVPSAVKGYKTVQMEKLIPVLIEGIKELEARVKELEAKLEEK